MIRVTPGIFLRIRFTNLLLPSMSNLNIVNHEAKGVFMKAVMYENFSETPKLATLPDPIPENDSVVIKVKATGL